MSWFNDNSSFEIDEIAIAKAFCVVCVGIGLFGFM